MASISSRKTKLPTAYLRRSAEILRNVTGEYISEVMPNTSSIAQGIGSSAKKVGSAVVNSGQIVSKIRNLNTQDALKRINQWFLRSENDFDDPSASWGSFDGIPDSDLSSDDGLSTIAAVDSGSNEVAKAVVETSHKVVESQIALSANMLGAIEQLDSTVTAGFDRVNQTLNKILEVITKNTSTLIETTAAMSAASSYPNKSPNSRSDDPVSNLIMSGRFNFKEYSKIVSKNFEQSMLGMGASMGKMFIDMAKGGMLGQIITPETIVKGLASWGLDKKAPNLRRNLRELDESIGEIVLGSLARLGSYGRRGGFFSMDPKNALGTTLAKIFGINADRESGHAKRSSLELKSVPFSSIDSEAITGAIPGYLRKILVQLGGPDLQYDYRSRTFRGHNAMRKRFMDAMVDRTSVNELGYNAKKSFREYNDRRDDKARDMLFNILTEKLNTLSYDEMIQKIGTSDSKSFVMNLFEDLPKSKRMALQKRFGGLLEQLGEDLSGVSGMGKYEFANYLTRVRIEGNERRARFTDTDDAYRLDNRGFSDTLEGRMLRILESNGVDIGSPKVSRSPNPSQFRSGVNYTNLALYNIYRLLDRGINTFVVGMGESTEPYPMLNVLKAPRGINDSKSFRRPKDDFKYGGSADRNGSQESSPSERKSISKDGFKEWGKSSFGRLIDSLFNGSPQDVKRALGDILVDLGSFAKTKIGEATFDGSGDIFSRTSDFMFGKRTVDGDGNVIKKSNGLFGSLDKYIFGEGGIKGVGANIKDSTKKWLDSVGKMFDYGDSDGEKESATTKAKRRSIMATSIGAMAGFGILGGPFGLLVGAMAGSAVGATDGIGSKIKKFLFGDKDPDKKGKIKEGLLEKFTSNIIDPIRFQIGKTLTAAATNLKKNILGPLSNIGAAIKDRIAEKTGEWFGGLLSKIGGGLLGLLKTTLTLPFKLITAPFTVGATATRGAMDVGGAVVGGGMNAIARAIAGEKGREEINRRISEQSEAFEKERAESGYYSDAYEYVDENGKRVRKKGSSWKVYRETEKARRRARGGLSGIMGEETSQVIATVKTAEASEKLVDVAEETQKTMSDVSQDTKKIVGEIKPGNSFRTYDEGLHKRFDALLGIITGNHRMIPAGLGLGPALAAKSYQHTADFEEVNFANSMLGAAATIAAVEGSSAEDERTLVEMANGAAEGASKDSLLNNFRRIISSNKQKAEKSEKSILGSIFEKISGFFGFVASNWKVLLGIGAGIFAIFKSGGLKNLLDKIGDRLGSLLDWIKGGEDTSVTKAVSTMVDAKVDNPLELILPGTSVSHATTDAAGNDITNRQMSDTLNKPWSILAKQALIGKDTKFGRLYNRVQLPSRLILSGTAGIAEGARTGDAWGNFAQKGLTALGMDETASGMAGRGVQAVATGLSTVKQSRYLYKTMKNKGLVTGAAAAGLGLAGGYAGGMAGEWIGTKIAESAGMDEEAAAAVAAAGNLAGTLGGRKIARELATSNNSAVKFVRDKLLDILEKIGSAIVKKWPKAAGITKLFGKVREFVTEKVLGKLTGKITALLTKLGVKNASAVATAGISAAIFAGAGAISGYFNTENLFGVPAGQADKTMKTIATALGAIFNLPFIDLIELLDIILVPIMGKSFRQMVAEWIYNAIKGDDGASLSEKQGMLQSQVSAYNEKFGTNLTAQEYNNMVNRGLGSRILHGKTLTDENGNVIFNEDGSVATSGGVAGWWNSIFGKKDKSNAQSTVSADPITEVNDMVLETSRYDDLVGSYRTYKESQYELDANGKPLLDQYGKKIKKGELGNVLMSAMGDYTSTIVNTAVTVAEVSGTATTAKSKSNGNWFTNSINSLVNWTKSLFRKNSGGGIGGDVGIATVDTSQYFDGLLHSPLNKAYRKIQGDYAFGYRIHPDGSRRLHTGVDLSPSDGSGSAGVLAAESGIVTDIRDWVPNGDTAVKSGSNWKYTGRYPEGNYIKIRTDKGVEIINKHLRYGSIPERVRKGLRVFRGQYIGDMGSTGWSTGPHLHFELKNHSGYIDPQLYLEGSGSSSSASSTVTDSSSSAAISGASRYISITDGIEYNEDGTAKPTLKNAFRMISNTAANIATGFMDILGLSALSGSDEETLSTPSSGGSGYRKSSRLSSPRYSGAILKTATERARELSGTSIGSVNTRIGEIPVQINVNSNVDLTNLETLLAEVLVELREINNNTASSSEYLGGLTSGQKGSSRIRRTSSIPRNPFPYSQSNVNSVRSIVRPT